MSSQIYSTQAVSNAASPIIKQGGIYHRSESVFCIKDQYHNAQFLIVAISQEKPFFFNSPDTTRFLEPEDVATAATF